MNTDRLAWFLVGATAVGKTAVAQCLAEKSGAAILSADAMLVYRGMDIGTAKPTPAERGATRYFGLDLVNPDQPFSTGTWLAHVREQLHDQPFGHSAAREPDAASLIVAGGTGLYIRVLTSGLDAAPADASRRLYWQKRLETEGLDALRRELASRSPSALAQLADPENPRRVIRALEHLDISGTLPDNWQQASRPRVTGLRLPRAALHERIAARVERMFASGFVDEVAALRKKFPAWSATAAQAIGYSEVCEMLDGRMTQAQAIALIAQRTRQLAKRQETWFRHQADVTWVDAAPDESVESLAARVLATWREHGATTIQMP